MQQKVPFFLKKIAVLSASMDRAIAWVHLIQNSAGKFHVGMTTESDANSQIWE
jgi:hypothetical protein